MVTREIFTHPWVFHGARLAARLTLAAAILFGVAVGVAAVALGGGFALILAAP